MKLAKPEPNPTARYLARLMREARNGKIIGFAAVVLYDGPPYAAESWHSPLGAGHRTPGHTRLVGEAHMLASHINWEVAGGRPLDQPPPLPERKKK